ncbi:DMSO/TMAO reductase YedYZ molybdopterin-dependent catalytic subunit [Allocatelliglobosispora scoriae]|uniref:DMSO/TMAO reductase YedYZ molybdopterin-dependent catalytic subunit n=1 Tax=Allocatelliglobosispora scoriae TaxID=643052 RepID=A0A841BY01_9ACTN|nr:molybdopterin-dependent oxidoreductase [Allocatelliglobosispora scoriae]MBB5871551.1 DMSO/TMAO reductase YedYZ molybdopterin-dependent catalytic subunit [Allocatelliglobosispora scoriae]
MVGRGRAAIAGVVAAAVALGAGELIAIITGAQSGPVVAVGGWIVDHVPEGGKELAIRLFGTYDKIALQIGTVIILAGFAALIGILAARRFALGIAGIGLFGVVGAAAALTRPHADPAWVLPSLIGAGLAVVALKRLLLLAETTDAAQAAGQPDGRRRFLRIAGWTGVAAVVVGGAGRMFTQRRGVAEARDQVTLPAPTNSPLPLPDNTLPGYVTSNDDFYRIDTALIVPQVDPKTWKLRIHGMVEQEITITYDELLAMPMIERYITIACVSNEVGGDLIGNARWLGVPVKDLLERAKPLPGADQVVSRSVDGWTCGSPTATLMDGRDALLAVGMNGEPLPIDHGFPVRVIVPGLYGYVSACKWIAEWEVTTFNAFDAYWVPRGWSAQGPIKTESRIDTPRGSKSAGEVVIAGVAWAQHRGIDKVEVQVDEGPWQVAELLGAVSEDTWRQWRLKWQATPGEHRLTVRATDRDGVTQTQDEAPPAPDGATGWHSVRVSIK